MQTDVNGIEQAVTEGAREVLQDKSMSENERKEAVARMAEQEKEREKQKAVQEKLVQNRDKCERAAREIMVEFTLAFLGCTQCDRPTVAVKGGPLNFFAKSEMSPLFRTFRHFGSD